MNLRIGPETIVHVAAFVAVPVLIWFIFDQDRAGPILVWLLVPLVGVPVLCITLIALMELRRRPPGNGEEVD